VLFRSAWAFQTSCMPPQFRNKFEVTRSSIKIMQTHQKLCKWAVSYDSAAVLVAGCRGGRPERLAFARTQKPTCLEKSMEEHHCPSSNDPQSNAYTWDITSGRPAKGAVTCGAKWDAHISRTSATNHQALHVEERHSAVRLF